MTASGQAIQGKLVEVKQYLCSCLFHIYGKVQHPKYVAQVLIICIVYTLPHIPCQSITSPSLPYVHILTFVGISGEHEEDIALPWQIASALPSRYNYLCQFFGYRLDLT